MVGLYLRKYRDLGPIVDVESNEELALFRAVLTNSGSAHEPK